MGNFLIWIVAILVIIAIVIAVVLTKKKGSDDSSDAPEIDPLYESAKKDMFDYLNQVLKKMAYHHRKGKWKQLKYLGLPGETTMEYYERMIADLKPRSAQTMKDLFGCLDLTRAEKSEDPEAEQPKEGIITDREKLLEVFLSMMLPFYPVYYREMNTVRYSALLDFSTLDIFHQLTGKRYRVGYKNRHKSGAMAFERNKNIYKVFDENNQMLCDASFKDGRVWDGYAMIKDREASSHEWEVVSKGFYQEGEFTGSTISYTYRKPVQ